MNLDFSDGRLAEPVTACILCASASVFPVIRLAPITIATPVLSVSREKMADSGLFDEVPLVMQQCADCGHLQLSHLANTEIVYRDLYVYATSMSRGLDKHFEAYIDAITARYAIVPGSRVVEIGSNDGTLLAIVKSRGYEVLGVDPARGIARIAQERGIETIAEFFTLELAQQIRRSRGPAGLMIANNVMANIPDMSGFLKGVAHVLSDDGVFVVETGYGRDIVERFLLDTIYHEHLSYYLVRGLAAAFHRAGLEVFDVERSPSKGGSLRISSQRRGGPRTIEASVARFIAEEETSGIFTPEPFRRFTAHIDALRARVRAEVDAHRAGGGAIAAYGVSAGMTTLLAEFGIEQDVAFLVDDDLDKAGLVRGHNYAIAVCTPAELLARKPSLVIILAWRYAAMIMAGNAAYLESGGTFLIPLPEIAIHGKVRAAP